MVAATQLIEDGAKVASELPLEDEPAVLTGGGSASLKLISLLLAHQLLLHLLLHTHDLAVSVKVLVDVPWVQLVAYRRSSSVGVLLTARQDLRLEQRLTSLRVEHDYLIEGLRILFASLLQVVILDSLLHALPDVWLASSAFFLKLLDGTVAFLMNAKAAWSSTVQRATEHSSRGAHLNLLSVVKITIKHTDGKVVDLTLLGT